MSGTADVERLLNRARSEKMGSPSLSAAGELREEFKDVSYLLERALHLSFFDKAGSYEARTLHLKRFMSIGLAKLPKSEAEFRKEMTEYMAEHLEAPKVEPRPKTGSGVEAPQYEIQTNLRGGGSVEVYREHLEFAVHSVREAFYEEQYNDLMLWADRLVLKLVDYKILPYKDAYQGGKIGRWARRDRAERASVLKRFQFEEDELEEPED